MDDETLIADLRRAAAIWFKNTDLLLLEEFIRRFNRLNRKQPEPDHEPKPKSTKPDPGPSQGDPTTSH